MSEWMLVQGKKPAGLSDDIQVMVKYIHGSSASGMVSQFDWQELYAYKVIDSLTKECSGAEGAMNGEWIKWNGANGIGLSDNYPVRVKHRNGLESGGLVSDFEWRYQGNANDIVGYQLIDEKKEYTGGSVSYYTVKIDRPTTPYKAPYEAECNDIIEALGMDYAEGNVFKAIWRMCAARQGKSKEGYKDGLYDAEKAAFFSQRLVEREKAKK